jgi:hypothetical protein
VPFPLDAVVVCVGTISLMMYTSSIRRLVNHGKSH